MALDDRKILIEKFKVLLFNEGIETIHDEKSNIYYKLDDCPINKDNIDSLILENYYNQQPLKKNYQENIFPKVLKYLRATNIYQLEDILRKPANLSSEDLKFFLTENKDILGQGYNPSKHSFFYFLKNNFAHLDLDQIAQDLFSDILDKENSFEFKGQDSISYSFEKEMLLFYNPLINEPSLLSSRCRNFFEVISNDFCHLLKTDNILLNKESEPKIIISFVNPQDKNLIDFFMPHAIKNFEKFHSKQTLKTFIEKILIDYALPPKLNNSQKAKL